VDTLKKISTLFHKIGLANIIAIGTLILTLTTFYYQFWRVSYSVKATFIAFMPNYNGAAFTTDAIFTNSGNRQCSIAKMSLMGKSYFKDERYKAYSDGWSIMDSIQTPFSLSPNEVVSKQLLFGEGHIIPEYKIPQCLQDPNCLKADRTDYRVVVVIVDAEGKCHEVLSDILTTAKNNTDEFEVKRRPYILTLMPSPVKVSLQSAVFPQRRILQPKPSP
jgi:hypothetical protein